MTAAEKRLVARRAAGEYAILDSCQRIWSVYRRKERSVYTDFLRVIFSKGGDGRASLVNWDEYEAAARAVLVQHPEVVPPEHIDGSAAPPKRVRPAQLKRHQILEALRRPWPTRGIEPPG